MNTFKRERWSKWDVVCMMSRELNLPMDHVTEVTTFPPAFQSTVSFFLKFAKCNRGGGAIGRNGSAEGRGDDEDAAGGEGHRLPQGLHRRLPSICPTFSLTVLNLFYLFVHY